MDAFARTPHASALFHAGHYENFPVASVLLPARLRPAVRAIYAFARTADDIADEGELSPQARLAGLEALRVGLEAIGRGETPAEPPLAGLAVVIRTHGLPLAPFHALLEAFAQDVSKSRYAHFGEVMAYCRKSANPIGRLLLALFGDRDPKHQAWSDGICSALQLTNMLQDIAIDYRKGRIYLPQDEMARFGVSERQIAEGRVDALWQQFMHFQIERARRMLAAGAPLARALPGRIGLELRLIVLGGERILYKLHAARGDVFTRRPVLTAVDWLYMLRRAVFPGARRTRAHACGGVGCGGSGNDV
ncbi:MAG: squalene synthase HpnC [Burkholderiales bacterium]|nr:squalene synthase HpnC [Burkholderiales bacterium]